MPELAGRERQLAQDLKEHLEEALRPALGQLWTRDAKNYTLILLTGVLKQFVDSEHLPLKVTPHLDPCNGPSAAFFSFEPHDSYSKTFLVEAGLAIYEAPRGMAVVYLDIARTHGPDNPCPANRITQLGNQFQCLDCGLNIMFSSTWVTEQ